MNTYSAYWNSCFILGQTLFIILCLFFKVFFFPLLIFSLHLIAVLAIACISARLLWTTVAIFYCYCFQLLILFDLESWLQVSYFVYSVCVKWEDTRLSLHPPCVFILCQIPSAQRLACGGCLTLSFDRVGCHLVSWRGRGVEWPFCFFESHVNCGFCFLH